MPARSWSYFWETSCRSSLVAGRRSMAARPAVQASGGGEREPVPRSRQHRQAARGDAEKDESGALVQRAKEPQCPPSVVGGMACLGGFRGVVSKDCCRCRG